MKKFLKLIGIVTIAFFIFGSCNNKIKTKAILAVVSPVSSDSIIAKYKNTQIRKERFSKGIYNYVDTTYRTDTFIVKDTISEISVTSEGKGYLILGRSKNHEDVQCFFADKKELDSLSPKQVVTILSDRHAARQVTNEIGSDTIKIFVVQMTRCKLINK
jgi:hypothetical protein